MPRDDEHNKPLFADARQLLRSILNKGIAWLEAPGDEDEDSADGEDEPTP